MLDWNPALCARFEDERFREARVTGTDKLLAFARRSIVARRKP